MPASGKADGMVTLYVCNGACVQLHAHSWAWHCSWPVSIQQPAARAMHAWLCRCRLQRPSAPTRCTYQASVIEQSNSWVSPAAPDHTAITGGPFTSLTPPLGKALAITSKAQARDLCEH